MKILRYFLIILVLSVPCSAMAATVTTTAILSPAAPVVVTADGSVVHVSADFGVKFQSLDWLRFVFYFDESDLFDPGEQYWFGKFYHPAGYIDTYGKLNVETESLTYAGTLLDRNDTGIFIGGVPDFNFWMETGSVTLSRLELIAIGEFTPVPILSSLWLLGSGLFGLNWIRKKMAST